MPVETGTPKPQYSPEERAAIFERVCEYYESQNCTIQSAADAAGIGYRTFALWRAQHAEFAERYKKARSVARAVFWEDIIQPKVESSLVRLLAGERKTEKKVKKVMTGEGESAELNISEETITESEILPNAAVTIFVAKGLYPERFVDQHNIEGQINVVDDSWFTKLPLEQRIAILKIKNAGTAESEPAPES